ncbi:uncharacterized protein PHACADRAFT_246768 [Phanerochaete carnosa HHB-10118-sp]|uniref:Uncharacterized protein n=1 Tax=Phanerochaete carnosa (strain HHB-10118-sp) TaxID=650164 RepID=K5VCN2_PHACS|nr:uncharacterized protein PHACADRAFT_246768 [Phanerochaete carnosa HHB-10118-sp]EKM60701.1 hypothetical protein PHACADRAFT_246768 [Phanerochaete carnosa HHB-10118-sp]
MSKQPEALAGVASSSGCLRPLPNPSTGSANPSASLPALWGYLQPALDHIVRSSTNNLMKAPAIEVSYHMGLHTAVYNYFTSQSDSTATVPKALSSIPFSRPDKTKQSGTDLYEQLDRYYADTARELFLGVPHDDSSLIHYLLPCFSRYSAGAQSVNRLLDYVNRHYVKRAVDEDKGWLRLADVFEAVAKTITEDDTREKIQKRMKERRTEELRRWGYYDGAPAEMLAQAEACAEAASPPDRVVPLSSLAHRRFRTEVIDPLLAIPKAKGKKKHSANGQNKQSGPKEPKGRLARAVKELLEGENSDADERRRLAGELAILLRTVGIRIDHPLRKKLDRFIAQSPQEDEHC